MILKLIGAFLIIAGCGGIGFRIAANFRMEEKNLRQLIGILDYMECELQYRLTPLPQLCRQAAKEFSGVPGKVLQELALEMESQVAPDVEACMNAAMDRVGCTLTMTGEGLRLFGRSVGRFDLEGQLKGLESVRQDCRRRLELFVENRDSRLRSYKTLGLCAGAALAILLV